MTRTPDHDVAPLFHERWSPRAFSGEEIPVETLMEIFEAARWAPSAGNSQPWRFVYGRRGTAAFAGIFDTLAPPNQAWAANASALVAIVSATTTLDPRKPDPVPLPNHSFDAGAAWAHLALQAHLKGWATHAMAGFDGARAREVMKVPADHQVEAIVAVGRRGDPSSLPEWAKAREAPNGRRPLAELVHEGTME